MGSWDAWKLLQAHPNLFAGAIISAGCPDLSALELQALGSNKILNFVGELDREELRDNVASVQTKWVCYVVDYLHIADADVLRSGRSHSNKQQHQWFSDQFWTYSWSRSPRYELSSMAGTKLRRTWLRGRCFAMATESDKSGRR